jgi:hypothetical protein
MSGATPPLLYMPLWLGEEQIYFHSHNEMGPVPQRVDHRATRSILIKEKHTFVRKVQCVPKLGIQN